MSRNLPEPISRYAIGVDYGERPDPTAIVTIQLRRFTMDEVNATPIEEVDWTPYLENSKRDHFLFDITNTELYHDLEGHLLAGRLRELYEDPQLQTFAQLSMNFGESMRFIVQDERRKPYMGMDISGAGKRTYTDMKLFGIDMSGYTLTGGQEETLGKKGTKNIPKLKLFSTMISAFERGWIRISDHVEHADRLREELATFRWKTTRMRQRLTVQHDKESDHDDLLTAMSCAIQAAMDDIDHWRRRAWTGTISR